MRTLGFGMILAGILAGTPVMAEDNPQRVLYVSGVHTLNGYIYKPEGQGPFPAVIFNQPQMNDGDRTPFAELAGVFLSRGYVFFVPGRHILGPVLEKEKLGTSAEQKLLNEHQKQAANILSATKWLKSQSYIDQSRVAMFGDSAGGVSSLLLADKNLGVSAMIVFSPGTQALKGNPAMQARLTQAVEDAKMPIFLFQAENDVNLLPREILGAQLERRGGGNRVKVYPAFGVTKQDSHKLITEGYTVWQNDVFAFLAHMTEPSGATRQTN